MTVSGAITGAGKLIKSDAGQVTIVTPVSGQNTFSGGTLISSGTVLLGDINAVGTGLGTGTITLNGSTLSMRYQSGISTPQQGGLANNLVVDTGFTGTLIAGTRQYFSGALTGGGTLNFQTDYVRVQEVGNWSGFTGQINVTPNTNGGDFRIISTAGFGTAKINLANGVTMYMQTNFAAGGLTNSIGELTGGTTSFLRGGPTGGYTMTWSVGGANTNAQFDGSIQDGTGPTAITKVGTGTWTLTGANRYTGATLVSAGTLQIGNGTTTGSLGTAAVTNNATLAFNRSDAVTVGNTITGTGAIVQSGSGALTLSASGNTAATLFLRNGTTIISGTTTLSNYGSVGVSNGEIATLQIDSGSLTATAGAGDFKVGDLAGSTGTINLTGTGSITAANLYLGKNNDVFTAASIGTVNQSGGTLIAKQVSQGIGASGTFNFNGGTLQAGGANATFMTGLTAANVKAGGAKINDGGFAVTIGQALIHDPALGATPDGGLTKSGTGTLSLTGTNTYTRATAVNAGKLLVGVAGVGSITSNVTVASGATVGGSGTITGDLTLSGESSAGAGNGGALAAGNSPGVLTATGTTTFNTGSIFSWDLDSSQPNPEANRGIAYDGVNTTAVSGSGAIFQVVLQGTQSFGDNFWTTAHTWSDIFTTNDTTPVSSDLATVFSSFTYANGSGSLGTPSAVGSFTLTGSTLSWSAVPEPTSALAGLLLGAGLLRRRRSPFAATL